MRSILFVILISIQVMSRGMDLSAQTLHLLIVVDVEDQSIGKAKKKDLEHINLLFNHIAVAIDYQVSKTVIKPKYSILLGKRFNTPEITNTLLNLKVEKNDLVVFFYGGHGARAIEADNPFARVGIAEDKYTYLSLRMVQDLIQLKRPRFSLVLGNLCNGNYADPGEPDIKQKVSWNKVRPFRTDAKAKLKALFLDDQGHITVTSSQPGTLSYTQTGGDSSGGIFTMYLHNTLIASLERTDSPRWEDIFKKTSVKLEQHINRTPYFEIILNDGG